MITRADLQKISNRGCQHADHKESDCEQNRLWLHFRDYMEMPAFLMFPLEEQKKNTMIYLPVDPKAYHRHMEFGVEGWVEDWRLKGVIERTMFRQDCHPDSAVWLSYLHNSGLLTIHCYDCKAVVGEITAKP